MKKDPFKTELDDEENLPVPDAALAAELEDLISETRMAELRKIAEKRVRDKLRARKEAEILAKLEKEYEQSLNEDPFEEVVPVLIDVPGHTDCIRIDGRRFDHGRVFNVKRKQADTLNEVMARAWDHENEIGGANRGRYTRPSHNFNVSPRGLSLDAMRLERNYG